MAKTFVRNVAYIAYGGNIHHSHFEKHLKIRGLDYLFKVVERFFEFYVEMHANSLKIRKWMKTLVWEV